MLKKRIKLLCALLAAAGILTSAGTPAAANGGEPSVSAKAAVLMTADNSTVLYEKAAEEKLPMASTTKIMTALLTLDEILSYLDVDNKFMWRKKGKTIVVTDR